MEQERKKSIAKELFAKTKMTREQYREFCLLAEELDLDLYSNHVQEMNDLLENL